MAASRRGDIGAAVRILDTLVNITDPEPDPRLEDFIRQLARGCQAADEVRAAAWEVISRSCESRGDQQEAIAAFEQALELGPNPERLVRLAKLRFRAKDNAGAASLIREGMERWPDSLMLQAHAAWFALDVNEVEIARPILDNVLERDPHQPDALAGRARLAIMERRSSDAVDAARAAGAHPSLSRALLAIALEAADRVDEDPGLLDAVLADLPLDTWVLGTFADVLIEHARLVDAHRVLDRAVRLTPADARALSKRGYVAALQRDYDAAAADYESAAELVDDPSLTFAMGEVARLRGDFPRAIELLRPLAENGSGIVGKSLGLALLSAGEIVHARNAFQRVLDGDPDDVDALCYLGELALRTNDPDSLEEAERLFRRAVEVDPTQSRAHALLAETYRRTDRLPQALEGFDRALSLAYDYTYARASKGQTLVAMNDVQAGIDELTVAAQQAPMSDWIIDELVAALETHEPAEADEVLRQLQRGLRDTNKDIATVCARRASLAARQRRWVDAERLFRQARHLNPGDRGLALGHVGALRALGRDSDAISVLNGVESSEDDGDLRWIRIELLWSLGRLSEARDDLEMLNKSSDRSSSAAAGLGEIYRTEGRRDDARRLLTAALKTEPDYAWGLSSLGALEAEEGNFPAAREHLRHSLELQPDNHFALSQLIALEIEAGDEQAARQLLETIPDGGVDYVKLRASALYRLGEYARAWRLLNDHLIDLGNNADLMRLRGWTELALGKQRAAARSFLAAAEQEDAPLGVLNDAWALTRLGEWRASFAAVRRALEGNNSYGETALAVVLFRAGAWTASRQYALASLKDRLDDQPTLYVASVMERFAGSPSEALRYAEAACNLAPNDIVCSLNLAECQLMVGKHEQAMALCEWVSSRLARRPALDADDIENQGWCSLRLGRFDDASVLLLRALSSTDQTAQVLLELLLVNLLDNHLRQAELLAHRVRDEVMAMDSISQCGVLAQFIHHLSTFEDRLAPDAGDIAERLAIEYRAVVDKQIPDLAKAAVQVGWDPLRTWEG